MGNSGHIFRFPGAVVLSIARQLLDWVFICPQWSSSERNFVWHSPGKMESSSPFLVTTLGIHEAHACCQSSFPLRSRTCAPHCAGGGTNIPVLSHGQENWSPGNLVAAELTPAWCLTHLLHPYSHPHCVSIATGFFLQQTSTWLKTTKNFNFYFYLDQWFIILGFCLFLKITFFNSLWYFVCN